MAIAPELLDDLKEKQQLNKFKKENPFTFKRVEEIDLLRTTIRIADGKAINEEALIRGSSGRETDSESDLARLLNTSLVLNHTFKNLKGTEERVFKDFAYTEFEQFKQSMLKPEDGPPPFIIRDFGNFTWEKLPYIIRPFKNEEVQPSGQQFFVLSYFYYTYFHQYTIDGDKPNRNGRLKKDLDHGHVLFKVEPTGFRVYSQVVNFEDIDNTLQPKIKLVPSKTGFYGTLEELIRIELSQDLLED